VDGRFVARPPLLGSSPSESTVGTEVRLPLNCIPAMQQQSPSPLPRLLRPPVAFWAVAALSLLTIVGVPGQSSPTPFYFGGAIIEALLLVGLGLHSQICRWLLLILALAGALTLLVDQLDGVAVGDVALIGVCAVQAGLLCSPAMRAFTDQRPSFAGL
jgi:hypothetical protein